MPAGVTYNMTPLGVEKEVCNVDTIYRLAGGFNLDTTHLTAGSYLPPLAPLAINFTTRKAVAVKNVKVYEGALSTATSIKIAKNSLAYANMYLGDGTEAAQVTAIDTSNDSYDVLTISLGAAVSEGDILFETSSAETTVPLNAANYLNYARTKIETGATVTAIGQVFEIRESKLTVPVSSKDKTNLGSKFMFV